MRISPNAGAAACTDYSALQRCSLQNGLPLQAASTPRNGALSQWGKQQLPAQYCTRNDGPVKL